MTKKQQPKVSDIVEILIQQMSQFESVMADRNQELVRSISKINSIKVDFNFEELEARQQQKRKNLELHLINIQVQAQKNNEAILNLLEKKYTQNLLYLIILNAFLFTTTVFSLYIIASKLF